MRKIFILSLFLLFLLNREIVVLSGIDAIKIWTNTIFPLLFPTFIISDLLISSGIVNIITRMFGKLYARLFKLTPYGMYILLIAFISGTPTNAKNLKLLYDNQRINEEDITKILSTCVLFNPLLIISMCGAKILIILWIANILTGIIMNYKNEYRYRPVKELDIPFNLNRSIENNINILLNILGTITIFLILANILPIPNTFLKIFLSGILEVTNGLNKITLFFKGSKLFEYLALSFLSFGGISILIQIKSILKDTSLNLKYYLTSRFLCAQLCLAICALT